jgi:peroxiredoxin
VKIVGVSFDTPAENLEWAEEEGFKFELWSDSNKTLALTYGAAATETQSIAGRITVLLGEQGEWLLVYNPVNVISGPGDVLEDCQALFGG